MQRTERACKKHRGAPFRLQGQNLDGFLGARAGLAFGIAGLVIVRTLHRTFLAEWPDDLEDVIILVG